MVFVCVYRGMDGWIKWWTGEGSSGGGYVVFVYIEGWMGGSNGGLGKDPVVEVRWSLCI